MQNGDCADGARRPALTAPMANEEQHAAGWDEGSGLAMPTQNTVCVQFIAPCARRLGQYTSEFGQGQRWAR